MARTTQALQSHYSGTYLTCGRLHSFAHQLESVLRFEPQTVLEVGVGPGLVTASLRQLGIDVTTVDVEPNLHPDVCASVTDLPLAERSVDVSMCCQVLEHLPFDDAMDGLRELHRVTRTALVMSVPDITRHIGVSVTAPRVGRRRITVDPPRLRPRIIEPKRAEHGGHHWEIGYRGYGLPQVRAAIEQCGWSIERTWRVPELTWHRFFVLRPRST